MQDRTNASATQQLRAARDFLQDYREDYEHARAHFTWPRLDEFNFGLDWFDVVAQDNDAPALCIVEADGSAQSWSYAQLSARSNQVASFLRSVGVRRGSHVMVMLGNQVELWESMLACIKLGAVLLPTTTQLRSADLSDRAHRGEAEFVIVNPADAPKFDAVETPLTRIVVGASADGDRAVAYAGADSAATSFAPEGTSAGEDLMLLYFTSGTTSSAKMVAQTHTSYTVGHLSSMYWMGLQPGDVHLNVASPGWAKHAWSNFFSPFIAEACVFIYNYARFDALALMEVMDRHAVTSFCAPPTVWRMLIQADLLQLQKPPTKVMGAGEPLNPEVIARVERDWGVRIRDGYGQTETTLQIGNSPGQELVPGAMGRVMPGYDVVLVDPATGEIGQEGEVCLRLDPWPVGLTQGYWGDAERTAQAFSNDLYHTGDIAVRDADGVYSYVGRADDVFKASDYRLSPFELESVLIEHEAVAEAAVVPSPDPIRLAVPKAYVVLAAGWESNRQTAEDILRFCRENLAPYKRIRRIEFTELPKTISGKIRRVELRARELELHGDEVASTQFSQEWADTDFDFCSRDTTV